MSKPPDIKVRPAGQDRPPSAGRPEDFSPMRGERPKDQFHDARPPGGLGMGGGSAPGEYFGGGMSSGQSGGGMSGGGMSSGQSGGGMSWGQSSGGMSKGSSHQSRQKSGGIDSAFIPGDAIDRAAPWLVRIAMLMLLGISWLGTIVAFHGGNWGIWLNNDLIRADRVFAGLALQGWCTIFQFVNRKNPWSPWYIQAYVLDVGPTAIAFTPIVAIVFAFVFGLLGWAPLIWLPQNSFSDGTILTVIAIPVAGMLAHFNARMPERRLIR